MDSDQPPFRTLQTAFELVEASTRAHEHTLQQQIRANVAAHGYIRDRELLKRLAYSSDKFFSEFIAAHQAHDTDAAVADVHRAFGILRRSRDNFIAVAGRFHASVLHGEITGNDMDTFLNEATFHAFTYASAASALVQAYRHLVSENAERKTRYEVLRSEMIDGQPSVKFFSDLRNINNHVRILEASPHYSMTLGTDRSVTTKINFDRNYILNSLEWSKESRQFISTQEDVEVMRLINEHYHVSKRFYEHAPSRIGILYEEPYRDLLRVKYARKAIGLLTSLKIVLQATAQKKLDPYPYLANWFNSEELERALSLPPHSSQQVDYLISLRDPLGFCDENTRHELYKLFSVVSG